MEALGLPKGVEAHCHRLTSRARQAGTSEELGERISQLAERVAEAKVPIPYATRRGLLSDLYDITDEDWLDLCAATGWQARPHFQNRRADVTAWVWATLVGGDWHFAPALKLSDLDVRGRETRANTYRAFVSNHVPRAESALLRTVHRVHVRYELEGPISWEPPP